MLGKDKCKAVDGPCSLCLARGAPSHAEAIPKGGGPAFLPSPRGHCPRVFGVQVAQVRSDLALG